MVKQLWSLIHLWLLVLGPDGCKSPNFLMQIESILNLGPHSKSSAHNSAFSWNECVPRFPSLEALAKTTKACQVVQAHASICSAVCLTKVATGMLVFHRCVVRISRVIKDPNVCFKGKGRCMLSFIFKIISTNPLCPSALNLLSLSRKK